MKKQNLRMLCVLLAAMLLLSGCTFRLDAFDRSETEQVEANTAAQEDYHEKLDEIVALLNEVYVDGYDTDKLGDSLHRRPLPRPATAGATMSVPRTTTPLSSPTRMPTSASV